MVTAEHRGTGEQDEKEKYLKTGCYLFMQKPVSVPKKGNRKGSYAQNVKREKSCTRDRQNIALYR